MVKKILLILFSITFIVACGSPEDDKQGKSKQTEIENQDIADENETDDESGINVEKGLFNVELTLPASLFPEDEYGDIEAGITEDNDADVTQNDDGSITVKMSKKDHKDMMADMKDEMIETIEDIKEDDEFTSIKDITYNNDFTEMKMIVDKTAFENSFDGFSTMTLGFTSMFYQAFDGKDLETDKIKIIIEDESTNEVIDELIYPDQLDEMEKAFD